MASFYKKNKTAIQLGIVGLVIVLNIIIGSQTWFKGFLTSSESINSITGDINQLVTGGIVNVRLPDIPNSLETTVLQDASFLTLKTLPPLENVKPESVNIDSDPLASFGQVRVTNSGIGNSLIVTWRDPEAENIASIRLYRSETFGNLGNVIANLTTEQRSYKDTNVTSGKTYFYALRGVDTQGNEAVQLYQYPGRAFDILAPMSPTNITLDTSVDGSVRLTWDDPPVDDFDYARVYRSTLPGQLGKLVADSVRAGEFTDTTNIPGVTYFYTVTAIDSSLNESPRDTSPSLSKQHLEHTGILAKGDILLLITNIKASGIDTGNAIVLSWVNPQDDSFDHVRIYRSGTFNNVGALISDLEPGVNSYTDTSVTRQTSYYYTLRTVDINGRESDNAIQYVAVARDTKGPKLPSTITVSQTIPTLIEVVWNRPEDVDLAYYRIYRSTNKNTYGHLVADRITTQQWTDTDIEDNRTYYYVITSVDLAGNESEKPIPSGVRGGRVPFLPLDSIFSIEQNP